VPILLNAQVSDAVWNALIEFQEEIQGKNLLIRCDNATVVAYINKQGGTKSIPLCLLLWDMMQWCLKSLQGYPSENIPLLLPPH
jgi:hypothetical protein